jgi:hypothetical protein
MNLHIIFIGASRPVFVYVYAYGLLQGPTPTSTEVTTAITKAFKAGLVITRKQDRHRLSSAYMSLTAPALCKVDSCDINKFFRHAISTPGADGLKRRKKLI